MNTESLALPVTDPALEARLRAGLVREHRAGAYAELADLLRPYVPADEVPAPLGPRFVAWIADAVVFLASDMARGITGQCLDVNCGEYHH